MAPVEPVVCLVTAPPADAERIATELVERELAACANIVPAVRSVYRWQGAVTADDESLLVIKTTRPAVAKLDRALRDIHPYDTFELVALEIAAGSVAYLEWIDASVRHDR